MQIRLPQPDGLTVITSVFGSGLLPQEKRGTMDTSNTTVDTNCSHVGPDAPVRVAERISAILSRRAALDRADEASAPTRASYIRDLAQNRWPFRCGGRRNVPRAPHPRLIRQHRERHRLFRFARQSKLV